jgi:hypothetical protein
MISYIYVNCQLTTAEQLHFALPIIGSVVGPTSTPTSYHAHLNSESQRKSRNQCLSEYLSSLCSQWVGASPSGSPSPCPSLLGAPPYLCSFFYNAPITLVSSNRTLSPPTLPQSQPLLISSKRTRVSSRGAVVDRLLGETNQRGDKNAPKLRARGVGKSRAPREQLGSPPSHTVVKPVVPIYYLCHGSQSGRYPKLVFQIAVKPVVRVGSNLFDPGPTSNLKGPTLSI